MEKKFLRKIYLIIPIFGLMVWGHYEIQGRAVGGKTIPIKDVTQKTIFSLYKNLNQGEVRSLSIYIFGNIDGTAEISRSDENQPMDAYRIGPGKVALKVSGDWSGSKCMLEYAPADVRSGQLNIRYRFRTFKK